MSAGLKHLSLAVVMTCLTLPCPYEENGLMEGNAGRGAIGRRAGAPGRCEKQIYWTSFRSHSISIYTSYTVQADGVIDRAYALGKWRTEG
jgi:hypothetical protein